MTQGSETSSARPAHGQLAYLQIPATDVTRSAAFYASVFGWQTTPPDTGFQAPGLIGQWVEDRPAAPADAGPVLWLMVDDIDASLGRAAESGGTVLEPPSSDGGVRWLATVRDGAGNTIGLVQLGPRGGAPSAAT